MHVCGQFLILLKVATLKTFEQVCVELRRFYAFVPKKRQNVLLSRFRLFFTRPVVISGQWSANQLSIFDKLGPLLGQFQVFNAHFSLFKHACALNLRDLIWIIIQKFRFLQKDTIDVRLVVFIEYKLCLVDFEQVSLHEREDVCHAETVVHGVQF